MGLRWLRPLPRRHFSVRADVNVAASENHCRRQSQCPKEKAQGGAAFG